MILKAPATSSSRIARIAFECRRGGVHKALKTAGSVREVFVLRWLRIDRRPAAASIGNALRRRRSDQPDYALPRLRRSGQGARPVRGGEHAGRAAATAQDHGSIATIPKASRSRARAALSAQGDRPRRWFLREYGARAVGDRRGASALKRNYCDAAWRRQSAQMGMRPKEAQKRRRLAGKSRRGPPIRRVSDGASPQIACGSYRSGAAGRAEETAPQASRTSLPPVLSPNPRGMRRAAELGRLGWRLRRRLFEPSPRDLWKASQRRLEDGLSASRGARGVRPERPPPRLAIPCFIPALIHWSS